MLFSFMCVLYRTLSKINNTLDLINRDNFYLLNDNL